VTAATAPAETGNARGVSRARLVLFVVGLVALVLGVVALLSGVAWGIAVAIVGFAIVLMTAPRWPGDGDSNGPGWTSAGPVGP
jgi:fatty acid desaturase